MRYVRVVFVVVLLVGLAGLLIATAGAQEKEHKIPVSKLPQKVVEAVNKKLPGAKIIEAEKGQEEGEIRYEVLVKRGGKLYEMEVNKEGVVREFKEKGEVEEQEQEVEEEEAEVEEGTVFNFDENKTGVLPVGWSQAITGRGKTTRWEVRADKDAASKPNVLAQLSKDNPSYHFNLAVAETTNFKNLELSVKFKAIEGKEDRGGGPVWRYQDNNNYYIARANPLESNFRVYKVVNGNRRQLQSARLEIPSGEWHVIKIEMEGNHIKCYYDGKKYLDVKDDTITKSGKIGLWTKADAVTYFDDLKVKEED